MSKVRHTSVRKAARAGWLTRVRAFLLPLLVLAQLGLALHTLNHQLHPDADRGGECTLCHVASNMVAPPDPVAFVPPVRTVSEYKQIAEHTAPAQSWATAGFRSRAPPLFA